jgi:preprotein translocase subunit SecA
MRRGIGLRGYAQQDPLNEFRREAFELYGELRGLIQHQVATTIFRVTVTRTPPPEQAALEQNLAAGAQALLAGATAGRGGATTSSGSSATSADGGRPAGPRPVGPVVGGGLPRDPMATARVESSGNGRSLPAGQAKPGFTPTGARIGRNDPCWCGSGQKYKKCHGR